MGINFNFGLGGKGDSDDSNAGTTGATDPATAVVADPSAGTTPPPTEPIMVTTPVADPNQAATPATEFGDDITINVTDAPLNVAPTPVIGEPQMTEVAATPVATPIEANPDTPLNPFADSAAPVAAPVGEVAPTVTDNPFATTVEPVVPTPVATEPVTLEANQATPVAVPAEAAPLNPFAADAEIVLPAVGAAEANPFATSAPEAVAPAPVEAVVEAANPFSPAEAVEAGTVPTEAVPEASEIKVEEVAAPAPVVAENPFAATEEKPEAVAEVVPEVKEEVVQANENPFADMNIGEEQPAEEAVIEEVAEDVETEKPEPKAIVKTKKGDGSSPLSSLQNIKAEIAGFVATHNQNVEDYKAEIKALEGKINGEKNLLKKRKQEFRNMLSEIETLTEDFTPHPVKKANSNQASNQEDSNQPQNNKPKRKRNRNKKTNQDSETNQSNNKDA